MSKTTLLILIGAGVLLVVILCFVFAKMVGKKKSKRLDEALKSINQEKEAFDKDDRITLPNEFEEEEAVVPPEENKELLNQATIEDYDSELIKSEETNEIKEMQVDFDFKNNKEEKPFMIDDDFEKFMNEHSYSRRVFNKPLLDKIRSLPADVRMLLLSNILDRHDD